MVEIAIRQSIMARARPNYYNLHEEESYKLNHDICDNTFCFDTSTDHINRSNQPFSCETLHSKSSYAHQPEHDLSSTTLTSCRTQKTFHSTETDDIEQLHGIMSKPEDGYETLPPAVRRKVRLIPVGVRRTRSRTD